MAPGRVPTGIGPGSGLVEVCHYRSGVDVKAATAVDRSDAVHVAVLDSPLGRDARAAQQRRGIRRGDDRLRSQRRGAPPGTDRRRLAVRRSRDQRLAVLGLRRPRLGSPAHRPVPSRPRRRRAGARRQLGPPVRRAGAPRIRPGGDGIGTVRGRRDSEPIGHRASGRSECPKTAGSRERRCLSDNSTHLTGRRHSSST